MHEGFCKMQKFQLVEYWLNVSALEHTRKLMFCNFVLKYEDILFFPLEHTIEFELSIYVHL